MINREIVAREPDIELSFDALELLRTGVSGLKNHPWSYAAYLIENRTPKGKKVALVTHFTHYDSMRYTAKAWLEDE